MLIYVKDSQSGFKNPASWYIPDSVLAVLDSTSTQHLLHEVTEMEAEFVNQQFEATTYKDLCPVVPIASGFDYVAYKKKLQTGQAEFLSRNATDFPKIGRGVVPVLGHVIPIGIGYDINFFQQQSAQRFGISIDAEGMRDCADYIDRKLNEAFFYGGLNPEGLMVQGLFDYFNGGGAAQIAAGTSIYKVALSTGASGNTWALKTGQEIYNDWSSLADSLWINSKKNCMTRKVGMGFNAWAELGKKSIAFDDGRIIKVRKHIMEEYPDVQIIVDSAFDAINFSETANETWDGNAGSGAIVALDDRTTNMQFRANDREILRPYEHKGFNTTVNTFGLTGGYQLKRAYAGAYMKGVS